MVGKHQCYAAVGLDVGLSAYTWNIKWKKGLHVSCTDLDVSLQRLADTEHFTDSMFSVCRRLCNLLLIVFWLCSAELACYLFYCLSCHSAKSHVCTSELTSSKVSFAWYLLLRSCSRFHTLIWGGTGSGVCMQTMKMFTFLRTEKTA